MPSACLAFRPAECRRLCPPGRGMLRLGCRARIRQPTVLLCTPFALFVIHAVTVSGPRWLHVTYLPRRDRGENLPLRLLTRKPFVSPERRNSTCLQGDPIHFLAEQPVKTPELLVRFSFSSFVRHYPISF